MIRSLLFLGGLGLAATSLLALPKHFPVKVAVVATFERGADTGDKPGEFQLWAERETWTTQVKVAGMDHPVYVNEETGVVGIVSGTTSRVALQLMCLGLSDAFDFTQTYWLIQGIAGVDPADASIGSAAWARWVIDGDIAYEIDAREADESWPYAIIAIGAKGPKELPNYEGWEPDKMVFELTPGLVGWAFSLTKDVEIPDTAEMQAYRSLYTSTPQGMRPPFVLLGDSFGSDRYWHGDALTQWADDWSSIWTGGKANMAMSNMEDHAIAAGLTKLQELGKVDFSRVLVLRTGSNYCKQPPASDVAKSLHADYAGSLSSVEAGYRVGSKVVHALVSGWSTYQNTPPSVPLP